MAKTLEEQLESVQNAIEAIENGAQEYSINDRTVTKGDLEILYRREARLKRAIERDKDGSRTLAGWG